MRGCTFDRLPFGPPYQTCPVRLQSSIRRCGGQHCLMLLQRQQATLQVTSIQQPQIQLIPSLKIKNKKKDRAWLIVRFTEKIALALGRATHLKPRTANKTPTTSVRMLHVGYVGYSIIYSLNPETSRMLSSMLRVTPKSNNVG